MNNRFVLLVLSIAAFTSCNVYKSGQTPDDVYYSPAKERPAYVSGDQNKKQYQDDYVDMNDRYLRMKTLNRSRWSAFDDDYMYWNDSRWNNQMYYNSGVPYYGAHPGMGLGYGSLGYTFYGSSYYSPWANPFCPVYYGSPIVIISPKPTYRNPVANGPRTFNLNTYTVPSGRSSTSGRTYYDHGVPRYSNSGTGSSSNPSRTFSNDRSSGTNSSSTNSSSGRSSSSSSSSGSAPVRRF
jgi:hypothetical protein